MFTGYTDSLLSIVDFQVHLDSQFGLPGSDICGFGLGVLTFIALDETLCLVDQDSVACLWFVLAGHSESRVEITNVFVHTDSFLSLACLDEFSLCLFVPFLVLQLEGILEMYVTDLMLGVNISHFERFFKLSFVGLILHHCVY